MTGDSVREPGTPETRVLSPAIDGPQVKSSLSRKLLNTAVATLAFLVTCAGLNAILPFPEIGVVASYLRFFKLHGNDFNTLFIGSSRIHHQVSPATFDRTMRERGYSTRTFNFGVNGMMVAESSYVLERLLRARPNHLKWVFIELDELEFRRFPGMDGSRRSVYWRDWQRTSLVLRKLLDAGGDGDGRTSPGELCEIVVPGQGKSEMRDLLFFHLALFGRNVANVSRKIDLTWWASHFWKKEKMPAASDLGENGDGYVALIKTMTGAEAARYEADLDHALSQKESRFVSASTEHAYRRMAEEVRKVGATPIFLTTPALLQTQLRFRPESGITGSVMSFNDATAYPQLYRKEMRGDEGHLNNTGAEEFTLLVAQNFSQLLGENRIE